MQERSPYKRLAMLIALFTALTLLPELLIVSKPYGPEQEAGG